MVSALTPAFLWAGAGLAGVAALLHLLARRPPERSPLPTARFLSADARTEVRFRRRPTDLLLLAVRVAFSLALGAAFAGVAWRPARTGTARVVVVDAGAGAAGSWAEVAAEAEAAAAAVASVPVTSGGPEGSPPVATFSGREAAVVLAYGLAGGAREVAPDALAALTPGPSPVTYEDGLRALRRWLVEETRFSAASVVWVAPSRWSAWPEGFALLRGALWPGAIEVRPVTPAPEGAAGEGTGVSAAGARATSAGATSTAALLLASVPAGAGDGPLARGLEALGRDVVAGPPEGSGAGWVFAGAGVARDVGGGPAAPPGDRGTVVTWGAPPSDPGTPWIDDGESATGVAADGSGPAGARDRGEVVLTGGLRLDGGTVAAGGGPAPGARVLAAFEDGSPAAAALDGEGGCRVHTPLALDGAPLVDAPDYPALLEALGQGCAPPPDGPLDAGALGVLRGEGAAAVEVADLGAGGGRSLTGVLVLLALLLLAGDVALSRERTP